MGFLLLFLLFPLTSSATARTFQSVEDSTDEKSRFPEATLTTPELIKYWGYPAETHEVITDDGYILSLHRIPFGRNETVEREDSGSRPVFLVQHALLSSSADWVVNLPNQSLGFMLADNGYDVWLGNVRGNSYSKKHVTLDVKSKKFWDYSVDEHSKLDLPAMISYILQHTNNTQLYYAGYSQGSMMAFAGLSENTQLQSKIKKFFALAPVSRITDVNKAVRSLASWARQLKAVFNLFGIREFYPCSKWSGVLQKTVCWWLPKICKMVMTIITGQDKKFLNETRLPVYVAHTPAGTSTKNMLHFFQFINTKLFNKYDYGVKENLHKYGRKTPPEYDLRKVSVPTVLFSGSHDTLASPTDVAWTKSQLPNVVAEFVIEGYNHLDFMWAINAGPAVNMKIIEEAKKLR